MVMVHNVFLFSSTVMSLGNTTSILRSGLSGGLLQEVDYSTPKTSVLFQL